MIEFISLAVRPHHFESVAWTVSLWRTLAKGCSTFRNGSSSISSSRLNRSPIAAITGENTFRSHNKERAINVLNALPMYSCTVR